MTDSISSRLFGSDPAQTLFLGFLFIFFTFASHYLQINSSGVGLELPFNAMGWIPLSFAIGTALYVIASKGVFQYTGLSVRLMVLVSFLVLPFFLPGSVQDEVTDRMTGLVAGLLFFLGLQQFNSEQEKKVLLLFMVIIAVWVELIIGWDRFLRSIGIGISETRPAWTGEIHGSFQQRNVFASFIATGIVLSGYLLGYCGELYKRKFQPSFLPLLFLPFTGIHLLNALHSRVGWFGTLLGVILVFPYLWRNAGKVLVFLWIGSFLAGFLLTSFLSENTSWEAPRRDIMTVQGLRQVHYPQTMEMILEKPVFGFGYGRFEPAYIEYTADRYARGLSEQPGISRLDHPHNELLFWAAEGGSYSLVIVLLCAWFVLLRVMALPLPHGLAVTGMLFPIVLHTQVEYPFYQSLLHWIVFILFIYWVDQLTGERNQRTISSTLLIRCCAFIVPGLTTLFMATTLQTGYLLARFESGMDPDVSSLNKITNPIVFQDRISWAIMSRLVLNAAINNQPELAQPFIDWAPGLLERKPRPNFFRYLILAYRITGDDANMQRVQEKARYLFPGESFGTPDIEAVTPGPVPFDAVSR